MNYTEREMMYLNNTESYNTSERFNVINTMDIVNKFERFGFEMTSVDAGGVRQLAKDGKGKHMVRMKSEYELAPGLRPEVIIHNAADGTRALNIRVGYFRFVCNNGIVAGNNLIPHLQIKHSNNNWEEMINEFIDTYEQKNALQKENIMRLQDTKMNLDYAYHMAEEAIKVRHSDARITNDLVDPLELLTVQRKEDRSDTAWGRFQVLQENLMHGNFRKYDNEGVIRKAKVLTNIDEIIRFNTDISDLFDREVLV